MGFMGFVPVNCTSPLFLSPGAWKLVSNKAREIFASLGRAAQNCFLLLHLHTYFWVNTKQPSFKSYFLPSPAPKTAEKLCFAFPGSPSSTSLYGGVCLAVGEMPPPPPRRDVVSSAGPKSPSRCVAHSGVSVSFWSWLLPTSATASRKESSNIYTRLLFMLLFP